ncbi:hypothetical protein C8J57DRAFT_52007 [Mycena rebaudengoi]|nr:hypothetical protein C8J57DRAFT_52007 [Mycena rebaudengoi]
MDAPSCLHWSRNGRQGTLHPRPLQTSRFLGEKRISTTDRPRRDASNDMIYTTNSLASFTFGPATESPALPMPIGPLDEVDDEDLHRRADDTPRQSLAPGRRDPRTPAAYYSPSRSDAASHHTFGTSSASASSASLSSPTSRSGSRSRATSHTSSADDLGGVTFNPMHHHPEVEFDSESEDGLVMDDSDDYDAIEVSSARGGGSMYGAAAEAAFERQVYRDSMSLRNAEPFSGRRPSLPVPIPGIPPSPVDAVRAPEVRERDGSIVTLRRFSRSLDDQLNVIPLNNGGTGGASGSGSGTATTPISVPETDGDWRSLSARSGRELDDPSSPIPVFGSPSGGMPTFASGGGGGGMEGFGFDLDWSAMQNGITGLDMNDVAVHARDTRTSRDSRRPSQLSLMLRRPSTASGGSIMYDPDTFSAAVRGWGGAEYERQRKYWTFRRDAADGRGPRHPPSSLAGSSTLNSSPLLPPLPSRGGWGNGGTLSPVRSRTGGTSILSGRDGVPKEEKPKYVPWRGMQLNSEEIWNSSLVGSFKVRRIELRPQKPQQRVTIDPFRGPFTLGPKPPHDGAYTNIHKHSKVMAFSIHRHYKPQRTPMQGRVGEGRPSVSTVGGGNHTTGTGSAEERYNRYGEERRRPTAMILLAPRHVQEAYTSTNTTKGLKSHGLLDEGRGREEGKKGEEGKESRKKEKEAKGKKDKRQLSSTGSATSAFRDAFREFPTPPPASAPTPATHNYPSTSSGASFDVRDPNYPTPDPTRSRSRASRRRRRDSLGLDDSDEEGERVPSRTTHNEAFSTMDASSIDQMVLHQDQRYTDSSNGVLSRVLRRGASHAPGPANPNSVYVPPWVTLQSRVKQEERRRRHDVLSNSFEDVGLLPPKRSANIIRPKKPARVGVDIFAQVPTDALFMLLPLWPGPTDPVSERNATSPPREIPTEQRQYLLVSYKPTDERATSKKSSKGESDGGRRKDRSSHSSPTSSAGDHNSSRGCDILLSSYHISARLVSHADLQGSGVRVPDEGLAVLGPWHEALMSMPQIATRDHGLLVIGTCVSREAGVEFDPEGLVKMGLCIPVPQAPNADEELQEEPVAELTPIGRAVLEMAWIGCIAVTSFGPAGFS